MSHTINDVQNAAFDLLQALREKRIDVATAHAGVEILGTVIASAKVAVDYLRTCGPENHEKLQFFDGRRDDAEHREHPEDANSIENKIVVHQKTLTGSQTTKPVNGGRIVTHRLR